MGVSSKRTLVVVALALAGFVAPVPSSAQPRYSAPRLDTEEPDVPNVPDRNGCVKQCDLDTLPCDPPLYKKADGRCTLKG